jgi:hypothetical protein
VRTTIDIPPELHIQAVSIARDRRQSLSQTVVELMRRGLGAHSGAKVYTDPASGRVLLEVARRITADDVRALEDYE